MSKLDNFKKLYKTVSKIHLTLLQSFQTGLLMSAGDLISQSVVEKKSLNQLDFLRTFQFFTLGICLVGPAVSVWYKFLQRHVREDDKTAFLKKMIADQFLFAPTILPVTLTALYLIQGKSWEETKRQIQHKYFHILLTNYMIWPLVQTINFKFVDIKHQVLFTQSVALFWNVYLSWKTQKKI